MSDQSVDLLVDRRTPVRIDESSTDQFALEISQREACLTVLLRVFRNIAPVIGDIVKNALRRVYGEDKWLSAASRDFSKRMSRFFRRGSNALKQDIFIITELLISKAEMLLEISNANVDHDRGRACYFGSGVRLERFVLDSDCLSQARTRVFHGWCLSGEEVYRCLLSVERLLKVLAPNGNCGVSRPFTPANLLTEMQVS